MQFYLLLAAEFALSLMVGVGIIRILLYVAYRRRLFDIPNERKVHQIPVPRLGGMSFLPALMIVIGFSIGAIYRLELLATPNPDGVLLIRVSYMLGSAMLLYVIGILDDFTDLNYKVKFLVQFCASAIMVSSGLWLNNFYGLFGIGRFPFYVGMPFTVLLFIFITNAINMIDGIDGLASGLSIICLAVLAVIFIRERRFIYATVSVTMLGAVLAFWLFNIFGRPEKKTKLYMGDTGSLTIGLILCFLIVSMCYLSGRNGDQTIGKYFAIVFSALAIPLLEVPRLIVTRLRNHKSPFEADANHIHHRLMRCGMSARKTLFVILAMDLAIVLLTVAMTRVFNINIILVIDIAVYVLIQLIIARNIKTDVLPKE